MKSIIKGVIQKSIHKLLSTMEERILASSSAYKSTPPVFILGAPRSGTTLLYELLVTCYHFSYFTNLANRFFMTPLAVSSLSDHFKQTWHGNGVSSFGSLKGLGAPNEAGALWNRWIPEFGYLGERDYESRREALFESASVIAALQGIHRAPFINKNVMHSVHIRLLNAAFPDCLFIDLRRDMRANVRSIVRARNKGGGPALDVDGWWSVRPRHIEAWLGLSMEEQACAQIEMLRRDAEGAFALIGEQRRVVINYEDICRNPESSLKQIAAFIETTSGKLKRRLEFPSPIGISKSTPLAFEAEERMEQAIARLGALA